MPDTAAPSAGAQSEKPAGAARHHGPGRGRHGGVKIGLATAAKTIGISEADLKAALRSGQSVADVAKSNNVEVQKVIDAVVAEVEKHLSEKVAAGELTQARADERSANLAERITALVKQARPGPGGHRRLGRPEGAVGSQQARAGEGRGFRRAGPGSGPGFGGDAPVPAPTATNA